MTTRFKEISVPFSGGINQYHPELVLDVEKRFDFFWLQNIATQRDRLKAIGDLVEYTLPSAKDPGIISQFVQTFSVTSLSGDLYVFGSNGFIKYSLDENDFTDVQLPQGYNVNNLPVQYVNWGDETYMVKPNWAIRKLSLKSGDFELIDSSPDSQSGNLAGRYLINSHNHLMTANIQTGSNSFPTRVQWSDLYLPDFTILEENEADFFDLDLDAFEITGLSKQRDNTVIYTYNSITFASYVGRPRLYRFEKIFTGVGNVFHYAQVSIKSIDFFIGQDNVYMLNGMQLSAIGDPIWSFFRDTIANPEPGNIVRGYSDENNYQVIWNYLHKDGYQWELVYNYKENRWYTRDPKSSTFGYAPLVQVRTAKVIDEYEDIINNMDIIIDGNWQFGQLPAREFAGGSKLYTRDNNLSLGNCSVETYEFDFDSLFGVKEINELKLLHTVKGNPSITLKIGTRPSWESIVTWSDSVVMSSGGLFDKQSLYHFRSKGVGKLVRFKFEWTNTQNDQVLDLIKLSFRIKVPVNEDVER